MIIILTQCFPPRIGGIENVMFNISYHLSKNNKVLVLADGYNLIKDTLFDNKFKNNFFVKRFGGLKYFRKRNKIKELERIINFNDVKAVISDSWKSLEITKNRLKNKKIPSICLAHGNELILKNKNHYNRIINTLKYVDKIISNSEYTKKLLQKLIPELEKIETIYPGVTNFEYIKEEELKLESGQPTLLTLARLEKRKGHYNILNAISKLKDQYPNIRYIVAGNGEEERNLKDQANSLKISKNVIFVGSVNDAQKKYIFNKTDLMIMPTIDETHNLSIEGFGIVYIEAALFGIPSITSNIGGTKEAVIHNETGIVLDNLNNLEDSIRELIVNKDKRKLYGQNAKNRAINELSWNKQISRYLKIITDLSK